MSVQGAAVGIDPAAFASGLRNYLDSTPELDSWRGGDPSTVEERMRRDAGLLAVLHDAGWSRYGWPELAGGLDGDVRHRGILFDELAAHDLPVPGQLALLETLAPPVVKFAADLARRYLPATLRGEEWWGQGFSESEAGSDLAALRCRATRDGEHYVVNGHKLWTSHGATASRMVCLVRTGTPESRHRGLSMLLIDADSPGVSARPVALANGRAELAEVFYDEVRVPISRLIGPEHGGWSVAMYLLQFERATYAYLTSAELLAKLRLLRSQASDRTRVDGAARRIGAAYLDVVALRARSAETVRRLAGGNAVGPEASIDKVLLATAEHSVHDAARELLAPGLEIGGGAAEAAWRSRWWFSRATSIFGGSAEVQRTILADHLLKLPKE
jgi:alkylation response protein AidB-like acyl-CoA dehydrogenase